MKRAWKIIDAEAARSAIKNISTSQTPVLAVVKADAYGHGATNICRMLDTSGLAFFGVVSVNELIELHALNLKTPLFLMSEPFEYTNGITLSSDHSFTVYSSKGIQFFDSLAKETETIYRLHLKVNTGMNRLGTAASEMLTLARYIEDSPHLILEGIYTHLSEAEIPDSLHAHTQFEQFRTLLQQLTTHHIFPQYIHTCASFGHKYYPEEQYNLLRLGMSMYMDVMSIFTRLIAIQYVRSGERVGYGSDYIATRNHYVGIISIGYSDGHLTAHTNCGYVLIKGHRYPHIGRVSMNYSTIDLGETLPEQLSIGDEVVIIGTSGNDRISMAEYCTSSKQSIREVMCLFGQCLPL